MKNDKQYAFLFKKAINSVALVRAQTPLRSTIITGVFYKRGFYYIIIHANNDRVIESYITDCNSSGVEFEKADIDMPQYGAVYICKA